MFKQAFFICTLFVLLLPNQAWAEVMDKEPSLSLVWMVGLLGVILGLLGSFKKRWLLIPVIFPLLFLSGIILELNDPYAGSAIIEEAGFLYPLSVYLLMGLIILSILIGFTFKNPQKK